MNELEALQKEYGEFFFPLDDVLPTTTEDTEMTSEARNFQEKREILKQSIADNLEYYPYDENNLEVYKKYKKDPLAYWREELKNYDRVLQFIKNIYCTNMQILIMIKVLLPSKIRMMHRILKEKENNGMSIVDRQSHDEEIAKIKSQIKKVEEDVEKLKKIHAAIEENESYKEDDKLCYYRTMERGISERNIDFVSSCNENNETTKCKDAIFNAWKVYIEQADLPKAAYINTLPRSWCEIYQSYDLTSIIRSAIAERVQELEAEPQAKEQGNEPSTFNDEMKGLSLTPEAPNSKGNLVQ